MRLRNSAKLRNSETSKLRNSTEHERVCLPPDAELRAQAVAELAEFLEAAPALADLLAHMLPHLGEQPLLWRELALELGVHGLREWAATCGDPGTK